MGLSVIELFKEDMKFSAGHFTVFSSVLRENLHGHNYNVAAALTTEVGNLGLSFDYREYKRKIDKACAMLDETVLIAAKCPYLSIKEKTNSIEVTFNEETMHFLRRDVTLLPICNVTVEELSRLFLEKLLEDTESLAHHRIIEVTTKVFSGPGQSGSATWQKKSSD